MEKVTTLNPLPPQNWNPAPVGHRFLVFICMICCQTCPNGVVCKHKIPHTKLTVKSKRQKLFFFFVSLTQADSHIQKCIYLKIMRKFRTEVTVLCKQLFGSVWVRTLAKFVHISLQIIILGWTSTFITCKCIITYEHMVYVILVKHCYIWIKN